MGLGIAFAGSIAAVAMYFVMTIFPSVSDNYYDTVTSNSDILRMQDAISKTNLRIHSIGAIAENSTISFNATNTGEEKLWNYEKFFLVIDYDADVGGVDTRMTEILSFNNTAKLTGSGSSVQLGCIGNCTVVPNGGIIRPDSDVVDNDWLDTVGGDSDGTLYDEINEETRNDSNYITTNLLTAINTNDIVEFGLTDVSDPETSEGHIVRYVYRKNTVDGNDVNLQVRLLQGAGEIASWQHNNIASSFALAEQTLSSIQADSITDYSDLRLEFTGQYVVGISGDRRVAISWAEFETPIGLNLDASGGGGASCSGKTVSAREWTIHSIGGDILDPQVFNPSEVAVFCGELTNPLFNNGNVTISFATDFGVSKSGTINSE